MDGAFLNEKEYIYGFAPEASMFNEQGAFTPHGCLSLINAIVARHLENIGPTVADMVARYGAAMALISVSAEIRRPVRPGDRLVARTWASAYSRAVCRRDLEISGECGDVISCATFCTLLDIKTRRVRPCEGIPELCGLPRAGGGLEASRRPDFSGLEFERTERRKVRPSFIDALGHVNNQRYAELAYDAMSEQERAGMDRLRRMDIWFLKELRPGGGVWLEKAAGDALWVRGVAEGSDRPAFAVRLEFGKETEGGK